MEEIVLIGGGGHMQSVADAITSGEKYEIIGYTDLFDAHINLRYLGTDDILESIYAKGITCAAITVGYLGKSSLRDRLYDMVKQTRFRLPQIIDPSAVVSDSADIGEGVFVGKNAVVNAGAKIGKMCIINTGAIIEHNNQVGDYSHIAGGAVLCGDIHVGEHTLIGANATIIQGVKIGMNSIIGAGSIVLNDVPENSRVVGVSGGGTNKAYLSNRRYAA